MAKKTDADGEWEEVVSPNGIVNRVLTKPSAAYKAKLQADQNAQPVQFLVCDRMALDSGRFIDFGSIVANDLTTGEITQLKAAGKTVLKNGAVQ